MVQTASAGVRVHRTMTLRRFPTASRGWLCVALGLTFAPWGLHGQVLPASNSVDAASVITGRALRAYDDRPLAGAVVYIEGTDFTTFADADGFFGLGPLTSGVYRVVLFHDQLLELGWVEPPMQLVIVPPGADLQVDFIVDQAGIMIEPGGTGSQARSSESARSLSGPPKRGHGWTTWRWRTSRNAKAKPVTSGT